MARVEPDGRAAAAGVVAATLCRRKPARTANTGSSRVDLAVVDSMGLVCGIVGVAAAVGAVYLVIGPWFGMPPGTRWGDGVVVCPGL